MDKLRTNRRWTIVGVAALAILGVVPVTSAVTASKADAAVPQAGDGTTSATAGASCWGIKQQYPTSANGTYWLLTASMDRPAQFACDMSTDGGGWVLVARGRNGWTFSPTGQGSPATVRTTTDGPGAFAPAALDTTTINNLVDRTNLATLPDGIRLERSTNPDGTTRQDYRLFSKARIWTWNLNAGQLLNKATVNGATYNGSNTMDTAISVTGQTVNDLAGIQDTRRIFTAAWTGHNNQMGFSFGTGVTGGSNSATNHLWTNGTEGSPLGFTRVWLRPRIANGAAGFTPIPAGGFPAEAKPLGLKNRSELAPWGVTGYNHTNEASINPWRNNVNVVKVYGDRVYVGGRFTGVQQGPTASPIDQGTIAAFDLDGNWISTFRPKVAGRVWDMTMTSDGKLIIGGDFTSVDGLAETSGLAALDPVTGKVLPSWRASVTRADGASPIVRGLASRGDWVYASGRFTTVKGGTYPSTTTTNAINVRASDGTPGNWRPQIYASAVRLRVSAAGDRVYMAGYFNAVNGDTNHGYFAITNPTTGAVVPGIGPWQPSTTGATFQQAVAESGDNILVGGSEHDLQMYDHNRNTLIDSHITKSGGDFQAIEVFDGFVYAGCHCMNWNYSGANSYPSPTNFRAVDPIRIVGRWNAKTLDYDTTWYPNGTKGINDEGIWSIDQDKRKCMWVGGDLVRGAYSGNAATDYLGGFARFCPTDAVVPTAPTNLRATSAAGSVNLTWGAAADNSGSVSYDVYRNDRVIATVSGTSYSDTTAGGTGGPYRYTVRASDTQGNRSASPSPISVNAPAASTQLMAFGSSWKWWYQTAAPAAGWKGETFDTTGWQTGVGELGFGDTPKATVITTSPAPRPLTSYYRATVNIANPAAFNRIALDLIRNAGGVVYVNGVEVGRSNMPAGTITHGTYASSAPSSAERHVPVRLEVPSSAFRAGTNTIAVEVHLNYSSQPTSGFDLAVTGLP
ncbi:MAG: hypothetical protein H0U29_13275 [Acidimicrobiia bacterium]|nr:hypothetical protein [Acidimicrobiia bacterium]